MKTRLLIIIGMILVGFTSTVYAQYMGNLGYPVNTPNECIGGPHEECPLEIIDKTRWRVGTIEWEKPLYYEKQFSKIETKVIVNDFDMNTHPTIKDWIAIQLWSESSPDKIIISQLFESAENSGIFEGNITLLNETSNPFQNKLKVNQTDVIFASYYDWTLPENQNTTKIEIITKSRINSDLDKPSCESSNSQVPLYGCGIPVTVKLDSPLKQFKSGIPNNAITCKEGLMHFIEYNGKPLCVKPQTIQKLTERGLAKKSSGAVSLATPGHEFKTSLTVEGLNKTYSVGQKIEFTVKFDGIGYGCGYPQLRIENDNHDIIWESGGPVHSCDPDMKKIHIEKEWKIGDNTHFGTPIIDKEGFYTLFVTFGDDIIQNNFWIKSHSDVEIIGLDDMYKVGDNVRFYVTVHGFGMVPCNAFTVSIKNDHGQTVFDIPVYNMSCPIPVEPENYEFYYPQKNDSYQLLVNQTGKYTISINFGADSLEKEFVVKENNQN